MGRGPNRLKMEEDISNHPITCGEFVTKRKRKEKWLGDIFHKMGLAVSVQETIIERTPRTKAAMFEIKGIIEDFRSQSIGGTVGAFDLWELSVIPMLLNNAGTWTEISEESIEMLENLQNFACEVINAPPLINTKTSSDI